MKRLMIKWIKFKLLFYRRPKGISYKGIVYLNKSAQKVMKQVD